MSDKNSTDVILGPHPQDVLGVHLKSSDALTKTGVPHRSLIEANGVRDSMIRCFRKMLVRHHVSSEALERNRKLQESIEILGFGNISDHIKQFPSRPDTQKGNLAEIVLAEYLESSTKVKLPVYRLRYNPNINQSMKGDDVLAFDLDSNPVRIIVGESKFRKTSSKAAVVDIVHGLVSSHNQGIPASLQFVADRLFETGEIELGEKVLNCVILFTLEKLQLDYVGLLMSDTKSSERLYQHTDNVLHRLAVISFGLDSPESIIQPCYDDLEGNL